MVLVVMYVCNILSILFLSGGPFRFCQIVANSFKEVQVGSCDYLANNFHIRECAGGDVYV